MQINVNDLFYSSVFYHSCNLRLGFTCKLEKEADTHKSNILSFLKFRFVHLHIDGRTCKLLIDFFIQQQVKHFRFHLSIFKNPPNIRLVIGSKIRLSELDILL